MKMGRMRAFSLFAVPMMLLALTSSNYSTDESIDDRSNKLICCYFGGIRMSSDFFTVSCSSNTADGKEDCQKGFTISASEKLGLSLDFDFEGRLWFFSIPSKAYSASFEVRSSADDGLWSSVSYSRIAAPTFVFNTDDYQTIKSDSGWKAISISPTSFAAYVLAWIDPYSPSPTCGYNTYPQIKEGFRWETDDPDRLCSVIWNDPFLGKTDLLQKWALIEENYQKNRTGEKKNVLSYVLGSLLLVMALALLVIPLIRFKGKRVRRSI